MHKLGEQQQRLVMGPNFIRAIALRVALPQLPGLSTASHSWVRAEAGEQFLQAG